MKSQRVRGVALISGLIPAQRLQMTMIGAIGQFEREMMLERQRESIAKARSKGKYKGRAPTARSKAAEARALRAEGVGATEIAKRLKIGRASVYRVLSPSLMFHAPVRVSDDQSTTLDRRVRPRGVKLSLT